MGVFPAASRQHVPLPFAKLMLDPKSPIIDFYPEDFNIDLNGKKFAWQGVALLPFVDEKRLFKAAEPYLNELTLEENKRNKLGDDCLYLGTGSPGFALLKKFYETEDNFETEFPVSIEGMQGLVLLSEDNVGEGGTFTSVINGLHDCTDNRAITVRYRDPKYPEGFTFPAVKLSNAVEPPKVLKQGVDQGNPHYRPVIGFNHNRSQFASVGEAGHRQVNHYTSNRYQGNSGGGNGWYLNVGIKIWYSNNNFITDRGSRGNHSNYQQNNRSGFGNQQKSRFDNRSQQGYQQKPQDRYNNAVPPPNYNNRDNNYPQRSNYQSGSSSSNSYQGNQPQGNNSSGGYQQWKAQRGGQQPSRGGYQRYESNDQQQRNYKPDKIPGPPDSRYGGSYSRE